MQVGFLSLLTLVFAAGKVFGALTWSWWLVFSPLLIGVPVVLQKAKAEAQSESKRAVSIADKLSALLF